MGETKDEWYVSRGGQRFGPVAFKTLVESARNGRLEPRSDLVIGGELTDWTPSGDVEGIFERTKVEDSEAGGPAGYRPPGDSLADSGSYDFGEKQTKLDLPGAPRLGYILGVTVLPAILAIGLTKVLPQIQEFAGPEFGRFVPLVLVIIPVLVIAITVKRFQNLGMSGWWLLGLLVPFLNWWLNYRLIACPPGYVYTKKLDVWGWILAVLYWLSVIGWIVAVVLFWAVALQQIQEMIDSGQLQEFQNQWESLKNAPPPAR